MNSALSSEDIFKIKQLNFLRIRSADYKGLLTFGILSLVLGLIWPYSGWSSSSNPPENFDEYISWLAIVLVISVPCMLPWLFNWLLKQLEIRNSFKATKYQMVSSKIILGYFKILLFENGPLVLYRNSKGLSRIKVGDKIRTEWTCFNRLIDFEIIETTPLAASKPEGGVLKYPFGLVSSWQTMAITIIPFGLGILMFVNLRTVGSFVFATALVSPFIFAWTTLFGVEVNLKAKSLNEYQIILGMKKNAIKRFSEINEVNLTHNRERKMSYHHTTMGHTILIGMMLILNMTK
jgi:hypothetical protein